MYLPAGVWGTPFVGFFGAHKVREGPTGGVPNGVLSPRVPKEKKVSGAVRGGGPTGGARHTVANTLCVGPAKNIGGP